MPDLENELKALLIESLDLENLSVQDIDTDTALFNEGLGLDSIDALEFGIALKKKYLIKLDSTLEVSEKDFYSVASLVKFLQIQRETA